MSKSTAASVPEKVTRDDIEAKLRELRGEVDSRVSDVKFSVTVVAVAVAVTAVVTAYWLGRRRGKRRQTVFEIRRI
jgi:cobalamin biosynthesis Mg chelatase CobN